MPRLKVIHIVTQMELGGAQQNTLHTVLTLDRERFDAVLFCGGGGVLDPEVREASGTLRTRIVGSLIREVSPPHDLLALLELTRLLHDEKPDIVHTHSSKAGILGRMAAWATGVPVIIHTFHGFGFNDFQPSWLKTLYVWAERLAAAVSTSLIFVSRSNWDYALRHRIGREDRYELIRSGIKLTEFPARIFDRVQIMKSLDLDPGLPLITSVGNFKKQKNVKDFLTMATLFTARPPHAAFLFVGDGPGRPEAQNNVPAWHLSKRLALPGWRRDIPEILASSAIFVLTSLWEGLPRSLVEAMKSGVPPVCYAADGITELIDDGHNGYIVPINDIEFLYKRIRALINDESLRSRLGQEAARSIGDEFDIDGMVRSQERLYLQDLKLL